MVLVNLKDENRENKDTKITVTLISIQSVLLSIFKKAPKRVF